MYTSFFGLNEKPFSITPDPRYLFMSARHTEALAHLMYGVRESGGFIQLTGEVGTGKTTLIRSLLQQLPDTADVALILNPQLSKNEFLSTICEELGVPLPGAVNSIKALVDALNTYLLDNHSRARRTILIVDEAQNLRLDVLEQVRLLTNLETPKQKLLQIILIGQPELRDILDRNDMRQLAQRVTGRYHLQPLSQDETRVYIEHRLKVAGAVGPIFSNASKKELYQLSRGVPRRINVMADRALLGAFTQEIRQVTPKLLRKAAAEVLDKKAWTFSPWRRWLRAGGIGIVLAAMAIGAGWAWSEWPRLFPEPETNRAAEASEAAFSIDEASHSEAAEGPGAAAENLFAVDSVQDEQSTDELSTDQATAGTGPGVHSNVGQFLHENSGDTSLQSAFGTLFNFWGITYSPETLNACRQAERSGLLCLTKSGSLAQVKNLNRPVLLTLRDYGGEPHKVVLSGLSDATAIISIADKDYRISVTEFIDLWFGDYLLLWRPESSPVQQFSPGMRSDEVIWLRQSLAEIQGVPIAPMDSNLFDSNLEARVRSYQRENRLEVDGVVGYQTQIIINTDLGSVNRPSLVRAN